MGCYLAIGLKIKTAIGKKEISKHLDEMPLDEFFKEIEKEYVLEELNSIPDTSSRLALLSKKSFQTYQMGSDNDYYRVKGSWNNYLPIYNTYAILSLDGKIIMECYNGLFNFLRRCIIAQMPEFKLSKALSIWIDG